VSEAHSSLTAVLGNASRDAARRFGIAVITSVTPNLYRTLEFRGKFVHAPAVNAFAYLDGIIVEKAHDLHPRVGVTLHLTRDEYPGLTADDEDLFLRRPVINRASLSFGSDRDRETESCRERKTQQSMNRTDSENSTMNPR
jgi:hypothetical protein